VPDRAASLASREHRALTVLIAVVSGLAWFALWHWGQSPYVHYVHNAHGHVPPASGVTLALVFLAGWTLMTMAMMLPTSMPLLGIFSQVARSRQDRPCSSRSWWSATC
jgi:predicted metal-binding membrane protein